MFRSMTLCAIFLAGASAVLADDNGHQKHACDGLPTAAQLTTLLQAAGGPSIGGLFNGTRMWAAVVNRAGEVCAAAASQSDPTQVWPGSQAIAKAKAYTANAFSLDSLALSTARLYTFTQPGHSLWSLGQSNPFGARFLNSPDSPNSGDGQIQGGLIFFGGGVPLYNTSGKIIGGLGVSGDTSCADHEIAKGVRDAAGFNPPGGKLVDDITYSGADGASPFTHPLCLNTKRNGIALGTEQNASGY
ncbi:MAG: heme-binding protein [Acidobacteriia bacterium]|nr:heme-binding protein [Terriglobia bacterium]